MKTGETVDVVIGAALAAPANAAEVVIGEDGRAGHELPEGARRNEDGTITLALGEAVTLSVKRGAELVREESFAELTFNRLTGADMRAVMAASDESRAVVLVARSARINEAIMNKLFDKMDARDVTDALACAGFFIASGRRKTGR